MGNYVAPGGLSLNVALARPTRIGSTATGPVASSLVERLKPRCLAMCGVCAGNPAHVALGDVIIAEMAYQYDEGKQTAESFEGDHRQYPLSDKWVRAAQDLSPEGLPSLGTPSEEEAKNWLLERVYAGDDPRTHPARARYFPQTAWGERVQAFEEEGLVRRNSLKLALTKSGRAYVEQTLFYDTTGPKRLPFEVKVGPIAGGNVVVKDGLTWDKLKHQGVRSVLGLEMEAATIGSVAHRLGVPHWVVVKGVMDHAVPRKDDRYKPFAARAAAEVLFKFLSQQLTPSVSNTGCGSVISGTRTEAELTTSQNALSNPIEETEQVSTVVPVRYRARLGEVDDPKRRLAFDVLVKDADTAGSPLISGVSWEPPQSDVKIARQIFIFLEDRRVLYNKAVLEVPEQCTQSVIDIREFLTQKMMELLKSSQLYGSLDDMRDACRAYLDNSPSSSEKYPNWNKFIRLRYVLNGAGHLEEKMVHLRHVFGWNVLIIALAYGLDVEGGLVDLLNWMKTSAPNGSPKTD